MTDAAFHAEVLGRVRRAGAGARLGERVSQQLLNALRSGAYTEGMKLPPERELSELLGVSRTVLREALATLQLSGLLVRHPGVGTVIARLPAEVEEERWSEQLEAGASIAALIEARMAVELGCVHVICDKAERNLGDVAALVDVMRFAALSTRSIKDYIPPSLEFHLAVARATESPVLASLAEELITRMREHTWLISERYTLETVERSLAIHEEMLAALQAGDTIAALGATKRHYVEYPSITPQGDGSAL